LVSGRGEIQNVDVCERAMADASTQTAGDRLRHRPDTWTTPG
jgi:hypothetical protein